jgi:hypothetical protein
MGLLGKLFGSKTPDDPGAGPPQPSPKPRSGPKGIVLMKSRSKPHLPELQQRLLTLTGKQVEIGVFVPLPELAKEPPTEHPDGSLAFGIRSEGVHFSCLSIDAPVPGLDEVIQTTRNDKALLAPLREHDSHLVCTSLKPVADPTAAYEILFNLAVALRPHGAIGITQPVAHQCFRIEDLEAWNEKGMYEEARKGMDKMIFCNLIPFHAQNGTWWATKGNSVFGVPDFALWVTDELEPNQVRNVLYYLFDYIRKGARIQHGERIALSDTLSLQAGPITEFREYLEGDGETLAFRFV